ncbi:hypothetical protein [Helicobacter rodentium]|nr:hypothetical protein [Helicobacter rodentium]
MTEWNLLSVLDYGLLRHFIPRNDAMVESSVCFYGLPRFLAESRNDGVGL